MFGVNESRDFKLGDSIQDLRWFWMYWFLLMKMPCGRSFAFFIEYHRIILLWVHCSHKRPRIGTDIDVSRLRKLRSNLGVESDECPLGLAALFEKRNFKRKKGDTFFIKCTYLCYARWIYIVYWHMGVSKWCQIRR